MISLTEDNTMLGYELMSTYPNISCFVTTRHGGCSKGSYASFNCSPFSGDEEEAVHMNRQKLLQALPEGIELVIPRQTHGVKITCIAQEFSTCSDEEKAARLNGVDALITREKGYALCVSTADCVPVLLYDHTHGAVAAIHAGWRGTVESIVGKTLLAMHKHFGTDGKDVVATIGPSISRAAFEVGEEVYEAFLAKRFPMDRISFWNKRTRKHHIDLWEANRIPLHAFGIADGQIQCAGICTYTDDRDFFSARRLGVASGRILSGIMMH